jgi:DNA-directed RNA polymerase specialized sigma24 family protein
MPFDPDTTRGGRRDRFPSTRRSVLLAVSSPEPGLRQEALSAIIEVYWKPVYKYVRLQWRKSNDDAKDITQGFFASLLERGLIERYDSSRAAFRTYLRTCVDGFVLHDAEAASRLKRGGGSRVVSLDFESAERELAMATAQPQLSMEELFHREWQRHLFTLAVEDLRRQCEETGKQTPFRLFEQYDLAAGPAGARPTYDQLAVEHKLPVTTITNHLAWARRELRRLVLDRLSAITSGDREFRREARSLLGGDRQ